MKTRALTGGLLTAIGLGFVLSTGGPAAAATAPVGLGTAAAFGVLAGTSVSNTGPSVVGGSLGVSPGTAITGFPPGIVLGSTNSANAVAAQAESDLTTAYNDAAGRNLAIAVTGDLGGQTLTPGLYSGTSLALTGTLTLDAQGDPNAVFVFQDASTLITASASHVLLVNGASPCGVFWQVGSSATFGTNSTFFGTVLALTSVTANTGLSVNGRLLARNGAVTLDTTTVTLPSCSAVTTSPSPTASSSASSAGSPSASASTSSSASPTGSPSVTPSASPTRSSSASPTARATVSPRASVSSSPSAIAPVPSPPAAGGGQVIGGPRPPVVAGSTVAPSPAAAPPVGPAVTGGLPRTGAPLADTLEIGLVLMAVGGVLCLSSTRRLRRS